MAADGRSSPSTPVSVTLTCRVTPAQKALVADRAAAAGCDVSEYLRDAVFEQTRATEAALITARRDGYWDGQRIARQKMDAEIVAVRGELAGVEATLAAVEEKLAAADAARRRAEEVAASWQRRAQELSDDLLFKSQRLMTAIGGVGLGLSSARLQVAAIWACLTPDEQDRLLPAIENQAREWIRSVRAARSTAPWDTDEDLDQLTGAAWLVRRFDIGLSDPPAEGGEPETGAGDILDEIKVAAASVGKRHRQFLGLPDGDDASTVKG